MAVGCTVFFIPQFTAPAYRPQDLGRADAACHINGSSAFCDDHGSESLSYYLPVFIFARVLTGIGAAPIYSAGINYMDDCSTREKFAMYSGAFVRFRCEDQFPAVKFVALTGLKLSTVQLSSWQSALILFRSVETIIIDDFCGGVFQTHGCGRIFSYCCRMTSHAVDITNTGVAASGRPTGAAAPWKDVRSALYVTHVEIVEKLYDILIHLYIRYCAMLYIIVSNL